MCWIEPVRSLCWLTCYLTRSVSFWTRLVCNYFILNSEQHCSGLAGIFLIAVCVTTKVEQGIDFFVDKELMLHICSTAAEGSGSHDVGWSFLNLIHPCCLHLGYLGWRKPDAKFVTYWHKHHFSYSNVHSWVDSLRLWTSTTQQINLVSYDEWLYYSVFNVQCLGLWELRFLLMNM